MHTNRSLYDGSPEKVHLTRIVGVHRTPKRDKKMLKVVGASWVQTRVSSYIIAAMSLLGVITLVLVELSSYDVDDGNYSATVFWRQKTSFKIEFWGQGNDLTKTPLGAARAYFRPDITEQGWSILEIQTSPDYPDWVQAYSAGLLEGSLTWQSIYWYWKNTVETACNGYEEKCKEIREFLEENEEVIRSIAVQQEQDPYWHQIRLFYAQLDGLESGWRYAVKRSRQDVDISSVDFLWMNAVSDLNDFERKFNFIRNDSIQDLPGLASAFIKLIELPGNEKNIFVAHNSVKSYQSMLRISKRYEFNFRRTSDPNSYRVPGTVITFTGYPGALSSQDDFYVVSSKGSVSKHKLIVTGTTINVFNSQLWSTISPDDLILMGPRVMCANRLANDGKHWAYLVAKGDIGTGNKQWSIVNLQNFNEKGDQKSKGLLWLVEQLPGNTNASDKTDILYEKGYWATYGIPHFTHINVESGTSQMEKLHGNDFSLYNSTRAKHFETNHVNISTGDDVMKLMRNINQEPSLQAIAIRGDLTDNPIPYGVIDTKIFSASTSNNDFMQAVSGPPYTMTDIKENQKTSPFQWSSSMFFNTPHNGQPDVWDFRPYIPDWVWIV